MTKFTMYQEPRCWLYMSNNVKCLSKQHLLQGGGMCTRETLMKMFLTLVPFSDTHFSHSPTSLKSGCPLQPVTRRHCVIV